MPYIPHQMLDCAIYLYPSGEAAIEGRAVGGTGFLVGINSQRVPGLTHLYAVTNAHVIHPPSGDPNPVVRLNATDGGADVIPALATDWSFHPDGEDLAVLPVTLSVKHRVRWVDRGDFLDLETLKRYSLGPGDECFMIGRFIYRDGGEKNQPAVRFGNISILPVPISQRPGRDRDQWSFVVEMRSLSGFSGSATFVYYPTTGVRGGGMLEQDGVSFASLVINKFWLLGVDWGNLPSIPNFVGDHADRTRLNSGMAAVVPAWQLAELLDDSMLAEARDEADARFAEKRAHEGAGTLD